MTETKLTKGGISTTRTPGTFAYEEYWCRITKRHLVQWDYRDTNGKLFSGIAKSIEQARQIAQQQSGEVIA